MNNRQRQFFIVIFFGLACFTIASAYFYWTTTFANRHGLELSDHTPVGGDFLAFYDAGLIFDNQPSRLYDLEFQWQKQKEVFRDYPAIALNPLPFVYPPLVAAPFKYLSNFDFSNAFVIWATFGSIVYIFSLYLLSLALEQKATERAATILIGLGFAPFTTLSIISGHASFIGVLVFASVFWALKNKKPFIGGILLSLSYYKPPLFLVFIIFYFMERDLRLIKGFLAGASALSILSIGAIGWPAFVSYLHMLPNYRYGAEVNPGIVFIPKQGAGLLAALTTLLPGQYGLARGIFLLTATVIVFFALSQFKSIVEDSDKFNLKFALQVSLSLFLSLQMVDYDLSLLVVPIIIVGSTVWKSNEGGYWLSSILVLFLVYAAWSVNNYYLLNFENLYSATIFVIWILSLWILFTTDKLSHLSVQSAEIQSAY